MKRVNFMGKEERMPILSSHKGSLVRCGLWLGVILVLAASVLAADERPPKPSAKDKCPVCGMFVAKYPEWIAQIRYKDGFQVYFDGAKDFFKYYHDLNRYQPARSRADIAFMGVTDYYTVRPIEAAKAFYVLGSDIYGPMGRELIPFEKEAEAREFLKDHKGKNIYRFNQITQEILKSLD
jgi:copper chaperone NosL